jgi:hypothetical protein
MLLEIKFYPRGIFSFLSSMFLYSNLIFHLTFISLLNPWLIAQIIFPVNQFSLWLTVQFAHVLSVLKLSVSLSLSLSLSLSFGN